MNKSLVGIVQMNNEFDGQVYLPLVAGYLEAIVKADDILNDKFDFIEPIFTRLKVDDALSKLETCSIVGFSVYVWNEQLTLKIASELKRRNKHCLIVFGGPQVPDNAEAYLKDHSFIDICVHNEGEIAFKNILEKFETSNFVGIPNTSVRVSSGNPHEIVKTPNAKRLNSLAEIPSPFLTGIFDKILENHKNRKFLALWESNRGCPFQCSFCDWGSATASKVNQFDMQRLLDEIEWIAQNQIEFVFVCDANFGILPRDEAIVRHVAAMKSKYSYPKAFSVQNTKNVKERAFGVQKLLSDSGLGKGVTLSMQSLNEDTLKFIKRDNISLDSYADLQNRFREEKVMTYSDLILGLPGETLVSWKKGIEQLISSGQHNRIQFNNLSILPNAEMGSAEYQKLYGFEKVMTQIINVHGSRKILEDDVQELQELVIATKHMNRDDWVQARVFAWWVAFLYFDKICQIPLMVLTSKSGNSTVQIIEYFLSNISSFPVLSQINKNFVDHARNIQNGGYEYIWDPDLIDVFWPADEYAFLIVARNSQISSFYDEVNSVLLNFEKEFTVTTNTENAACEFSLSLAISLNQFLLNVPAGQQIDDVGLTAGLLYDWYLKAPYAKDLLISPKELKSITLPAREFFSFETWCREIVWYGHRSGSYIFSLDKEHSNRDEMQDLVPGLLT